jgi:hypothetical protein
MAEPLPPAVCDLLANRDEVRARYPVNRAHEWRVSRAQLPFPFFVSCLLKPQPDTPEVALYRIYEFFVLNWNVAFRNELEYFCCSHPDWSVSALRDPADPDPVRYAILAVLTKLMCEAFNRRIEMGLPRDAPAIVIDFEELEARRKVYERPPEWVEHVPRVAQRTVIPNAQGLKLTDEDANVSEEFKAMNIIVQMPYIHFI